LFDLKLHGPHSLSIGEHASFQLFWPRMFMKL
jgi:hypothetical protein